MSLNRIKLGGGWLEGRHLAAGAPGPSWAVHFQIMNNRPRICNRAIMKANRIEYRSMLTKVSSIDINKNVSAINSHHFIIDKGFWQLQIIARSKKCKVKFSTGAT